LIDGDGYCKLCDFALSHLITESRSEELMMSEHNSSKYEEKVLFGTIEYLSPEILKGAKSDFASDIWSLGCLLYEMIHGVTPFFSKNKQTIVSNILGKDTNLTEFNRC
jgi:serine/threonine protein kinase